MADLKEVLRRNPEAASKLASMRDTLEILSKLRDAGIAKGDQTRPLSRKSAIGSVRPSRRMMGVKSKVSK